MSLFRKIQQAGRLYLLRSTSKGQVSLGSGVTCQVPVRCDGNGTVILGRGVALGYRRSPRMGDGEIMLQSREKNAVISIGDKVRFSNNVSLVATQGITIGADSLIGDQVMIVDSDFHDIDPDKRLEPGLSERVIVGKNVWLGSRVMVLKGVTIGDNAVIAAGSLVTKDIPPNTLAAGVPAKIVRPIVKSMK